ncbi:type III PLP-dependent enzyme [Dactylosporangium sp. AC04546]|uniref:type III PLP-dependent enzyme n=1 Tax=Dactylosporangium sp. AC04546 TaxID=2862460 RepID=UPI001EE0A7C5|nr:type III PLP-dependent enzyme [Dactylosporangium sp. AC04546]WVK81299.1 type III PLP-dependent enzyme [Dactylosporangium sp. AC04546]
MTGEHTVQGITIGELAERYGTPMYLYDGDELRHRFGTLRAALHPAMEIFFSLKANPNLSICALLGSLGARAEISSLAELVTAQRAGIPPEHVIFLGPGKSVAELTACVRAGLAAVVCESVPEIDLVDGIARTAGVVTPVVLRVNPAFSVRGSGLTMGGKPRQFGIDEQQVLDLGPDLLRRPGVRVIGVQAYVGTRILSEDVIVENTERIFELAERVAARCGFPLELVDVGGGLGVAYFDGERDLDPVLLTERLNPVVAAFADRHPGTRLLLESGRYLAATAGTYVVRVTGTKTSMGERFAVADGGTNHHMAAVGIGSFVKRNFPMAVLNRRDAPATESWHVTGPLCTPSDTLGKAVDLPPVRPGDLIGIFRSGAYGPSASPVLFLSHGHPAEVLVDGGRSYLIRVRDTVEDLLRPQRLYTAVENGLPMTAPVQ